MELPCDSSRSDSNIDFNVSCMAYSLNKFHGNGLLCMRSTLVSDEMRRADAKSVLETAWCKVLRQFDYK